MSEPAREPTIVSGTQEIKPAPCPYDDAANEVQDDDSDGPVVAPI